MRFSSLAVLRGGFGMRALAGVAIVIWSGAAFAQPAVKTWLDKSLDVETRVDALMKEMTLQEKIGQLWQVNGIGGAPTGEADNVVKGNAVYGLIKSADVGSILNEIDPATINAMQRAAVKETRLGIPLIVGRDVIHGYRTVMPIPLGQAATWNPELVEEGAAVAAREARSVGIHWTFTPMLDIARDPRWGRIAEGFGEDPYLVGALAVASVRGYQGEDLAAPDRVAACAKHYVGYGAAEGGRDYNTTVISPSLMRNVYLPPFKAAVDAGVATIMCSFNDVNGVPMSGNTHLLRDVLRKDWGFKGFVVSDWESIREMIPHGFAADEKDAALKAALGGVNMEMVSKTYHTYLAKLVEEGKVPESVVDEFVREILRVKFKLGLFEQPYAPEGKASILLADKHLEASQRLATESLILLKNEGALLPLDASKLKKVAIVGPHADAPHAQMGTWVPDGRLEDSRTPIMALKQALGEDKVEWVMGMKHDFDESKEGFAAAVEAAKQADVVIAILGERAQISGEASSRAIIDLPGVQSELLEAVAAVGKPVVLVVSAGRPLTIGPEVAAADAVIYSFHGGTMAGSAIADVLLGKASPSGKLPVTMPKAVGQIPLYYNHTSTGRPPREYDFAKDNAYDEVIDSELGFNSNYLDVSPYPLYPFGYGLSYTKFEYGKAELSGSEFRAGQTIAVRAPVKNAGKVEADEVVQLYVRDLVGSLARPVRELKGFRKIRLKPGEQTVVEFALDVDDLAYYDNEEVKALEPGKFEVYVGGSSLAPLAGTFEVR